MWLEIFEFANVFLATLLCSIVVKLVDDELDREIDRRVNKLNWSQQLGKGTLIYAMLLLAFAAAIRPAVAIPLFLASYMVGMLNDFEKKYPSQFSGFGEFFIVFILGICLFSWNIMIFALCMVMAAQLCDDCIDLQVDAFAGQRNFAARFGLFECIFLILLCLLISYRLDAVVFLPVLTAVVSFYSVLLWQEGAINRD